MSEEHRFSNNFENDDRRKMNGNRNCGDGFRRHDNGKRTWNCKDRSFNGRDRFQRNHPSTNQKKGKGKKSLNSVDVLKSKEEYSHLVNSRKLTVFDWDSTVVLRNLPAQIDAVKKAVQRQLKDISIKKFCPIKKTFKSTALVTLACVLNNKADVDIAVTKLSNLKIGDYSVIASQFVKPHSFVSNAFSACIFSLPDGASEKDLSEILRDCGVIKSLDVEYSESGVLQKVLVNLADSSALVSLLDKHGMQLKSGSIQVVQIKASCSVIVGNVNNKVSNLQISKIFEDGVLLVQKMSNMIFQVFFKDEEDAQKALSKDGESVKNLQISVRPWSKKNLKQYKVFISITGNPNHQNGIFDINKFLVKCEKVCSITIVKKNKIFIAAFESKEGQKTALELSGNVVNGWTVEVTKKRPDKKNEVKSADRQNSSETSSSFKKNHIHFE